MKAIVQNGYGSPDVLSLKDVAKPEPTAKEVLVRVVATSVNAGDLFTVKGHPFVVRLTVGFPRPKDHILGWDVAGIVESVGSGVSRFSPGDEVYGATDAAFAEFALGEETLFEAKPRDISFEAAAAIPTAAITALQRLRDGGKIKRGQRILVLGASGGVGSLAVQVARSYGCEVDGVCSARKREMVRSLGAAHVYAYDEEGFTGSNARYDLILDNTGRNSFAELKTVLADDGVILPNSGHGGMSYVMRAFIKAPFDRRIATMKIADLTKGDLAVINELYEKGWIKPHIDRTFSLAQTPQALEYLDQGHVQGKIVITM